MVNKLKELSENILKKVVKNRKSARPFVMFDCEDLSKGRANEEFRNKQNNKILIGYGIRYLFHKDENL